MSQFIFIHMYVWFPSIYSENEICNSLSDFYEEKYIYTFISKYLVPKVHGVQQKKYIFLNLFENQLFF